MKKIILIGASLFFLIACNNEQKTEEVKAEATKTEEEDHHHGHANHHMNKTDFNELAAGFENPEREEWQKSAEVIKFFGDLKNKTVIDIGAGTGYFTFKINEPSAKLIAADPDERFLEYMKKRLADSKSKNIEVRKAEYENPPVEVNEADLVFMIDVYHHIENRKEYFSKVKSGLKKAGKLVIVDFKKGDFEVGPPDEMKMNHSKIITELKEAGLVMTKTDTTTLPFQYMLMFE